MKYLIALFALAFIGCELPTGFGPPADWHYDPPNPVEEPIDTIPVDTIPTDTIIPCTELIEQTTPAFMTLYAIFDDPIDSVLWRGGGIESYNIGDVIEAITPLPYQVYKTPTAWAVIIDGATNQNAWQLKVYTLSVGYKLYMGATDQGFIFGGALSADQYQTVAEQFPSVKYFNFLNTNYDSIQYATIATTILGECKKGRKWADFRFNAIPIDTSIVNDFIAAKWDTVLQ